MTYRANHYESQVSLYECLILRYPSLRRTTERAKEQKREKERVRVLARIQTLLSYNVPNAEALTGANADDDNIVANSDSLPQPFAAKKKKIKSFKPFCRVHRPLWSQSRCSYPIRKYPSTVLRAHRGLFQFFQLSPWPILELKDTESGWVQRLRANNHGQGTL